MMQIFDITAVDLDTALALNEASVPHVSSIDLEKIRWFAEHAFYFRIARVDGRFGGFLIGLRPGIDYGSENYRWFCDNYRDFGYIDRVAVAPEARRLGIASALYNDFASKLKGDVQIMTCEVNIRPANATSMRFHEHQGFVQVASQETENGTKEVALMERKL
jgi:predicted GNAT superfamily acetyltransferase